MSEIVEMMRKNCTESDARRDSGLTTPEDIIRYDDIPYGSLPEQILDVYYPNGTEGILPVIVSVHGGGWVYGDKELYQFYCMSLAQRGFAVVNFTYRLAPEHKFPAALEDTALAFAWVKEHAAERGFDLSNVFAAGDSAGANLLELYCALCTNEGFRNQFAFPVSDYLKPKAVALNCGVHFISVPGYASDEFTVSLMKESLPAGGTEEELRLVNIHYVLNGDFPPAFVMTAEQDFLKTQVPDFCFDLIDKNIPFVVKYYCSETEEPGHVFHLNMRSEEAAKCNDEECAFFRSFM